MRYSINATSTDVTIDSYVFTSTQIDLVNIPIAKESNFESLFTSVQNGDLTIKLDGVDSVHPLAVISALFSLIDGIGSYELEDNSILINEFKGGSGFNLSSKKRIRTSDSSDTVPVMEKYNEETEDWEATSLEVGPNSLKIGTNKISQHGSTLSISDEQGVKKGNTYINSR